MNALQFCTIENHKIAYHRQGAGETMLLVHGITTYSFIWQGIVPALAENFEVITVDLLGCGDSDKPVDTDYSILAQARILQKLLKALGIRKVHLVCHDIGGGVGQLMALDNPDSLIDLILINTVGYDYWPVQPITTLRIPFLRILAMASLDLGMFKTIVLRGLYHKEILTAELMEYFWMPLKTKEGRLGFLHFAKCIDNRLLMDRVEDIRKITMPVLIIRGSADVYLSGAIADKLHKEIQHSRLERIGTSGHFIQLDEPELLSSLILDFVRGNPHG